MIETAVILAAGLGSRLQEVMDDTPKGFLAFGDKTIIEESIEKLSEAGIKRVILGTGFKSEKYTELFEGCSNIILIKNEYFASSGSMYTLFNMRHQITRDFLLLESDIIYEKKGLDFLLKCAWPDILLASKATENGDEVYIEADDNNFLVNMSKDENKLHKIDGQIVGISKISYNTFKKMCDFAEKTFRKNFRLDYEYALTGIAEGAHIRMLKINDYLWTEIDDKDQFLYAKNVIYPQITKSERS